MPTQSRNTLLLATDRQKSVLNAVDSTQNNAIAYTPYGDSPLGGNPKSQLRFNGELRELMTGYYPLGNGYRMYSPLLKRFLSPDNLCPFEVGGLNAYAYCECDPINRTDPTGHAWGLLKEIGRNLGLRVSNKEKLAQSYNSGYGLADPSGLFTHDSLKKAVRLKDPSQTSSLVYDKKTNTLHVNRYVKNNKFSFSSTTQINSKAQQISPEILNSITPNENLETTSPSTYKYVADIQRQLATGRSIGEAAIEQTLHPKTLKEQQIAIRKNYGSRKAYKQESETPPDPDRFLYRSGF